jgi:hypothetical protein
MTNAVDLTANDTVKIAVAFVGAAAASAISVAVRAPAIIPATATTRTAITTSTLARTIFNARRVIALAIYRTFAVGFGAFFVESFGFMRFVRDRFGRAFAFRRIVHSGRHIFVFVTRPVLAFRKRFAVIIIGTARRFFAITRIVHGIIFAWGRAVVSAATTGRSTARRWAPTAPAASAATAITITCVAAFAARTIRRGTT